VALLRIPIVYDRVRPPYIRGEVRWDRTGRTTLLDLVVDTGADDTVLSLQDLKRIGATRDRLGRARSPLFGVGGPVEALVMRWAVLVFRGTGSQDAVFDLDSVLVMDDEGRMGGSGPPYRVPSLIGRRFMEDRDIVLHWDFATKLAHLEVPRPDSGQSLNTRRPITSSP